VRSIKRGVLASLELKGKCLDVFGAKSVALDVDLLREPAPGTPAVFMKLHRLVRLSLDGLRDFRELLDPGLPFCGVRTVPAERSA
jgi:hypothetical protein